MRCRLAALTLTTLLAASTPAWADNHAEALRLFEEGKKQRDKGDLQKALTSFQASLGAEPSIGAYYNLGLINETLGHPQEAAEAYKSSATLAKQRGDVREQEALDAITKLRETHNYVTLRTTPDVAATPGLRVVLDGETVASALLNGDVFRASPSHELVISATGRSDRRLRPRNKESATVLLGEPVGPVGSAPPPPTVEEPKSGGGWGWQKWAGVGAMGAGVVTAVIGVIPAVGYFSDSEAIQNEMRALCKTRLDSGKFENRCAKPGTKPPQPTDEASAIFARAKELDDSSTRRNIIVFSLAGVLVVGGAILFLTAPSTSTEPTPPAARLRLVPQVGLRDAGLFAVGTF